MTITLVLYSRDSGLTPLSGFWVIGVTGARWFEKPQEKVRFFYRPLNGDLYEDLHEMQC